MEYLPFKIGHEGYEIEAHTLNISSTGAMCLMERNVPLMTKVKIGLTLPLIKKSSAKPKVLTLKGVVVRKERDPKSGRFFVAVYFSDIKPVDQDLLTQYIEQRLKG